MRLKRYDVYLNMDETPLYFDIPRNSTIYVKGVKTVKLKTTGYEKLRITVVLTAGVQRLQNGYRAFRLSIMFIFKNLKNAPKGNFPVGTVVEGSKGGTTTHPFMMGSYIPRILCRRPGGYFKSLSTVNYGFREIPGEKVEESLKKEDVSVKYIHTGMTPLLQFLDTHINKPFKDGVKEKWEEWISNGEQEFTKGGNRKRASSQEKPVGIQRHNSPKNEME